MTDSKYKLTYFGTKGLSEGIRFIFAYSNVDFEDIRIEKSDWPALKEKQPFGILPVLEVDGKLLNQSVTICRFLGKKFGLTPKDAFAEALLEALVDNVRDAMLKLMAVFHNKNDETEKAAQDALKYLFERIEKQATEGCFNGSTTTWVDLYFAGFIDSMRDYFPTIIDEYPNLTKLVKNVMDNNNVKKYIAKRPNIPPHVHN